MGSEHGFDRPDDADPKAAWASYAPRITGLYVGADPEEDETGNVYRSYLRFTTPDRVSAVTSSGAVGDVARWLGPRHAASSQGAYELDGRAISFGATSDHGTVLYSGTVGDGALRLHLDSHSLINGYRTYRTYYFVATDFPD